MAPSTRGFAPPSVSQRRSISTCYVFENYCNLLLQFAKRISYILLAFVVLSFLLFMIYHMLPVDKAAEKAKEEVQANKTLNYEERYQNWKVEYGFDGAKFERYLRWLGGINSRRPV